MSVDRFGRLPVVLGRVLLGSEAVAVTLWLAAPGALPAVALNRTPTRPSAVVGFLLLGAVLGLRPRPAIRRVLLAGVAAIALERLAAGVTGRPLLTARVLFLDRWDTVLPDGQMAVASALVLLSLALALAVSRARPAVATTLGCFAFGVGYVSLVGHLYGAENLSSVQSAVAMAPPTVPITFCAAIAVLLERPGLPAARAVHAPGTGGALVRASLSWALLVPVLVGWAVVAGERAGLFDPAYGQSLMVLTLTAGAITAIVLGARVAARADRHLAAAADRERLRYLLDGTPVGIFETDADGGRTYVNARWRELTGTTDEVGGQDWTQALHPDDRERVAAEWTAARERGEPYAGRYRYQRPDGTVRWVDTATTAIRRVDGGVDRWLGSVTDVTEQVEASRRQQRSERRYRSVVATMAEGVVLQDVRGRLVTVNQAASRILGIDPVALGEGRPRLAGLHVVREDGTPFPLAELPGQRALDSGVPVRDVLVGVRHADGRLSWLEVNSEPMHDAAGPDGLPVVIGAVTTFTDVTDARTAARALARSEERFRSAMAHAPVGMALVALDGTFMDVNHTLCRLLGYEETDLLGRTFQQITHPDDLESDLDNLAMLTSGVVDHYSMEKRYLTGDGDVVWVQLSVSMARGDDEEPAYYVAQVQDITAARADRAKLEHQALHDPLTGLANRDLLMDRLAHALARSARTGSRTLVMFCDLDHFKDVNDTFGHETGDRVLVSMADRLRAAMRPGDTVARLGGDEFVVVAESVPGSQQHALAARVQAVLDQPVRVDGREVRTGASIGVAEAGPDADARSVLREADAAMYRAKARGRNRYELSRETPVGALDGT